MSLPPDLHELLVKGEIISLIPPDHKFNVKSPSYIPADSLLTSIKRFFYKENSIDMMKDINATVERFIGALKLYEETDFIPQIVDVLNRIAINGLTNLLGTYNDYPIIVGELRVCISNIKLQLRKYIKDEPPFTIPIPLPPQLRAEKEEIKQLIKEEHIEQIK